MMSKTLKELGRSWLKLIPMPSDFFGIETYDNI